MDLLFEQYVEKLKRKGKSPHSVRAFTYAAQRLEKYLAAAGLTAASATFPVLEEYFDGLQLAPSSVGTDLRYIQAAYNYAASVHDKDEITLGYRLESGDGHVLVEKTDQRKAKSDGEDLLTPLVQQAAEAIAGAVTHPAP